MFFRGKFFGGGFFGLFPAARKRRWALKRNGKYRYFEDLQKLEAFRRAEDAIVVPRETELAAKGLGHPTIKLLATQADIESLKRIEREINLALQDEKDDDDFMQFLAVI